MAIALSGSEEYDKGNDISGSVNILNSGYLYVGILSVAAVTQCDWDGVPMTHRGFRAGTGIRATIYAGTPKTGLYQVLVQFASKTRFVFWVQSLTGVLGTGDYDSGAGGPSEPSMCVLSSANIMDGDWALDISGWSNKGGVITSRNTEIDTQQSGNSPSDIEAGLGYVSNLTEGFGAIFRWDNTSSDYYWACSSLLLHASYPPKEIDLDAVPTPSDSESKAPTKIFGSFNLDLASLPAPSDSISEIGDIIVAGGDVQIDLDSLPAPSDSTADIDSPLLGSITRDLDADPAPSDSEADIDTPILGSLAIDLHSDPAPSDSETDIDAPIFGSAAIDLDTDPAASDSETDIDSPILGSLVIDLDTIPAPSDSAADIDAPLLGSATIDLDALPAPSDSVTKIGDVILGDKQIDLDDAPAQSDSIADIDVPLLGSFTVDLDTLPAPSNSAASLGATILGSLTIDFDGDPASSESAASISAVLWGSLIKDLSTLPASSRSATSIEALIFGSITISDLKTQSNTTAAIGDIVLTKRITPDAATSISRFFIPREYGVSPIIYKLAGGKNYEVQVYSEGPNGYSPGWEDAGDFGIDDDGTFLPDGY